jgi:DNA-binding NarL/FixJ family response regulator
VDTASQREGDEVPGNGVIGVVIVEDHDLVRQGLRALLERDPAIAVVGEARNVQEALQVVAGSRPQVVLLDLRLGDEDGAEVSRLLRDSAPEVHVLVLSAHERSSDLRAAMAAGATGYLLKRTSPELLLESVRRVASGERVIDQAFVPFLVGLPSERGDTRDLSPREQQVLALVAEGLPNRLIAERLGISQSTAQTHMENLFRKFDCHDRTELVAKAFRQDFLE